MARANTTNTNATNSFITQRTRARSFTPFAHAHPRRRPVRARGDVIIARRSMRLYPRRLRATETNDAAADDDATDDDERAFLFHALSRRPRTEPRARPLAPASFTHQSIVHRHRPRARRRRSHSSIRCRPTDRSTRLDFDSTRRARPREGSGGVEGLVEWTLEESFL